MFSDQVQENVKKKPGNRGEIRLIHPSPLRGLGFLNREVELSYIAAGRLDGYYELCLGYYDMAAGICILEEAGGAFAPADPLVPFTDSRCDLVATNGLIQDWLFNMVQE